MGVRKNTESAWEYRNGHWIGSRIPNRPKNTKLFEINLQRLISCLMSCTLLQFSDELIAIRKISVKTKISRKFMDEKCLKINFTNSIQFQEGLAWYTQCDFFCIWGCTNRYFEKSQTLLEQLRHYIHLCIYQTIWVKRLDSNIKRCCYSGQTFPSKSVPDSQPS